MNEFGKDSTKDSTFSNIIGPFNQPNEPNNAANAEEWSHPIIMQC